MTVLTQVLTVRSWLYREHYTFLKHKRKMKQSLGLGSGSPCLLVRAVGCAGLKSASGLSGERDCKKLE